MELEKTNDGTKLTVRFFGEIDAANIAEIESTLRNELDGVTDINFDMEKLEYISSAGLRLLHKTQKLMKEKGSMKITNVSSDVMEIFEITGFVKLLNIE